MVSNAARHMPPSEERPAVAGLRRSTLDGARDQTETNPLGRLESEFPAALALGHCAFKKRRRSKGFAETLFELV